MAFFSKKSENIIGVDLGPSTIKIIEVAKTGAQPRLVTYGLAVKNEVDTQDYRNTTEQLAQDLKSVMTKARTTATRVVAALPTKNVFSTLVNLPVMPQKEITSAIQWEAKKLIPVPLENVSLAWNILPAEASQSPADQKEKMTTVMITAVPKDVVASYVAVFQHLNLELVGLETEVVALRRSLLPNHAGAFMVVDIGAATTNLIVFVRSIPIMTKVLDVGSKTISLNIAGALNISAERAEKFRDDFGLPGPNQFAHPVAKTIQFVVDNMIIQEMRRLMITLKDTRSVSIETLILTGGCANLKNLPTYLESTLRVKTIIGDPWQKISYPPELAPELTKNGLQMAVAIGLALKK